MSAISAPILATKLFIPLPGKTLVDRPRLLKRLDECLDPTCRLGLISAPAGFGKTTLLSSWASDCGYPVSWLTIDAGDNDPLRFLAYLAAAVGKIEADPSQDIYGLLQSAQHPALSELLPSWVLQLEASSRQFILVLDDYHLIVSREIHEALTYLIDHKPAQMHLVIATRKDPPLPIALLRGRGQMVELRQADLRFTAEEADTFLRQWMGVDLSGEEVATLANRTEGWAAGLQMAALSIRGREDASQLIASFSGSHEYIVDYFASEVLAQQPELLKSFLLQTSILDQLCGPLCDAVTGQTGGGASLERLRQENLFLVNMDSDRTWYRYHHLLRDLLNKQLQQETPGILQELHRKASRWYEQNGLLEGAIDHALQGEDFDRAASLICEAFSDSFWKRGETATILRWLDALPDVKVCSQPALCAYHALTLFLAGQLDRAEARLQTAESFLVPDERYSAESMGMIAAVRAYIAYFQGDGPAIIQHARQALDLIPEENAMWRNSVAINLGDAYSMRGDFVASQQAYSEALKASLAAGNLFLALLAGSKLAVDYKVQGHMRSAEEVCQQLIQLVSTRQPHHNEMAGKVYAIWGDILCERNELERAEAYLRKAVEQCRREGNVAALGLSYLYLLRVLWGRKDFSSMEETLHSIEKLAQESNVPVWISRSLVAWKSWVWMDRGRLIEAREMLRENDITTDNDPVFRGEGEYLSLARLLLAEGRPAEAGRLLDRLYTIAERNGLQVWRIVFLAMRAVASEAQGMREAALAHLEKALSLAEDEGYIRIFVEGGAPMAGLIHAAAARGFAPQYTGKLLAAFSTASLPAGKGSVQTERLVEPLSARELEVLRLLAEGLSNQEIAGKLYLSLRTIKFHTSNIYGKLGVKSRTEAVARARSLGLLFP